MPIEFDKSHASQDDIEAIDRANKTLARLRDRRKEEIAPEGPFLKSKLAWKIANYQQAILYRTVMLASGCALNWNARNPLCCILAARAMVETAALFFEFEDRLNKLLGQSDFQSIDKLTENQTFASRNKGYLAEYPEDAAINATTFIDKIDKRLIPGMRQHYDFLSEVCHPNSYGHFFFFGKLDAQTGTTHFSENNRPGWRHVVPALLLIPLIEGVMVRLDATILKVADLYGRT